MWATLKKKIDLKDSTPFIEQVGDCTQRRGRDGPSAVGSKPKEGFLQRVMSKALSIKKHRLLAARIA